MSRLPPSAFNLGAALVASLGIGAGYAGVVEGSAICLTIALLSAVVCALLQGIALQRAISNRLDALLTGCRPSGAPANDDGRRR
ncbi:hypothetical protein [Methylorubrum zatmanii]